MKKLISLALVITMLGVMIGALPIAQAATPIVAFPGAEGAGRYATGGRGGTVYHVTNLNDSGAGSFRDAVSASNRIVVFDVGGTVELKSDVVVKGNITIAGQTAPGGGGITLRGGKIGMGGDNIIIRFVSSRPGENGASECDAWGGDKGSNSIIDHCSIGWANDEQFGLYSNNVNQTVQYSIIGPSNCISYHSKGCHGFGIMLGKANNTWHHNMIAHNVSRNYRGKSTGAIDYVNNVIYNWGYQTAYGTFGQVNYVGNYFKAGLSTTGGYRFVDLSSGTNYPSFRFYLTGNKMVTSTGADYNSSINSDNWNGFDFGDSGLSRTDLEITSPVAVYDSQGQNASVAYNAQTADEAFQTVLQYTGAGIRADLRPRIDRQVMEEARTGTGYLTGGRDFSTLTSSDTELNDAIAKYQIKEMNYDEYYPAAVWTKEITDADNDGMDDEWEMARGLDTSKNDATGDYLGNGYNNIEYYINDLTVDAFPEGVVTLSPETVELGENYEKAKAAAEALELSTTTVKDEDDLILPTTASNGATITWSSSSAAIVVTNNKITSVSRPGTYDASVTLTANVTYGDFTIKRSFVVNVPAQPLKFDFGNGDVQSGFVKVNGSKLYTDSSPYGFVSALSDMERAPGSIPSGYEALHNDQVTGEGTFKAEVPNGKYTVVVHYGCWNDSFGTNFTIEGINTGNLDATEAVQYITEVEVTDGILDVEIKKGGKSYGGYINGLEILKPEYHFDFGNGSVQAEYTKVNAATLFTGSARYGFADDGSWKGDMERAPGGVPSGYENLHADQVQGTTTFKAKLPNGKYTVTINYGCWNTSFGTSYVVEGVPSGNLYSTVAAEYTTKVSVTDGVLDVEINKGAQAYGGYINGMTVVPAEYSATDKDITLTYTVGGKAVDEKTLTIDTSVVTEVIVDEYYYRLNGTNTLYYTAAQSIRDNTTVELTPLSNWGNYSVGDSVTVNSTPYYIKSGNIVPNGNFEYGMNGWYARDNSTPPESYSITTSDMPSVSTRAALSTGAGGVTSNNSIKQAWDIEIGKTYYYSMWVKAGDEWHGLGQSDSPATESLNIVGNGGFGTGSTWVQGTGVFTATQEYLVFFEGWGSVGLADVEVYEVEVDSSQLPDASEVTSFDSVEITVIEGNDPILPETITGYIGTDSSASYAVTWDSYDNLSGSDTPYYIEGNVAGANIKPVATVTVLPETFAPGDLEANGIISFPVNVIGDFYVEFDMNATSLDNLWIYTSADDALWGSGQIGLGWDNAGTGYFRAQPAEQTDIQFETNKTYRFLVHGNVDTDKYDLTVYDTVAKKVVFTCDDYAFRATSYYINSIVMTSNGEDGSAALSNVKVYAPYQIKKFADNAIFSTAGTNEGFVTTSHGPVVNGVIDMDLIPLEVNDNVVGITSSTSTPTWYSSFNIQINFTPDGYIKAYNLSGLSGDGVRYKVGEKYHLHIETNVQAATYNAWITDENGNEYVLATNYAYRDKGLEANDLGKLTVIGGGDIAGGKLVAENVVFTSKPTKTVIYTINDSDGVYKTWTVGPKQFAIGEELYNFPAGEFYYELDGAAYILSSDAAQSYTVADDGTATHNVTLTLVHENAVLKDTFANIDGTADANNTDDLLFIGSAGVSDISDVDADNVSTVSDSCRYVGNPRIPMLTFNVPVVEEGKAVKLNVYVAKANDTFFREEEAVSMRLAAGVADVAVDEAVGYDVDNYADITNIVWSDNAVTHSGTVTWDSSGKRGIIGQWITIDVTEYVNATEGDTITFTLYAPKAGVYVADHEKTVTGGEYEGKAAYLEVVDAYTVEVTGASKVTKNGNAVASTTAVTAYEGATIKLYETSSETPAFTNGTKVYATDNITGETGYITVTGSDEYYAATVGVAPVDGAQVRIGDGVNESGKVDGTNSGLRFITTVDYIQSLAAVTDAEMGVEITAEGSDAKVKIVAEEFQDDDKTVFTSALTNLAVGNFNRKFTATPYVIADGQTFYGTPVTRSIYQVAAGLLVNGSTDGTDYDNEAIASSVLYKVLNAYVNQTGIRLSFTSAGLTEYTGTGTSVYSGSQFFEVVSAETAGDNVYSITIKPLGAKTIIASYWQEYIRINNNNSKIAAYTSMNDNGDGTVTITFDYAKYLAQ